MSYECHRISFPIARASIVESVVSIQASIEARIVAGRTLLHDPNCLYIILHHHSAFSQCSTCLVFLRICSFKVVRRIVPVAIHCDLRMEKVGAILSRYAGRVDSHGALLILLARCTLCVHFD